MKHPVHALGGAWEDGWIGRRADEVTDGQMDGWMVGCLVDKRTDETVEEGIDRRMDLLLGLVCKNNLILRWKSKKAY